MDAETSHLEEYLDVLTAEGNLTGNSQPRKKVHAEGLFHRAVHVWLFAESTGELLLQKRAKDKDSWPELWDISSAGHISAGGTSLDTAKRELEEELGLKLPDSAFEFLFEYLQQVKINSGTFINNEYNDVYFVTLLEPISTEAFRLQASEVEAVQWMPFGEYEAALERGDPAYVPIETQGPYGKLFSLIRERYSLDPKAREERLRAQTLRYFPVTLSPSLAGLPRGDVAAVHWVVKASKVLNEVFLEQIWSTNPALRKHLEEASASEGATPLDKLKFEYFSVNKSPWSILDDNSAFLTSADSPAVAFPEALVSGFPVEPVKFRAAFPETKPKGANFYPSDMSREEFNSWLERLPKADQKAAKDFFSVIRRPPAGVLGDLRTIPYSQAYREKLEEASRNLQEAGKVAETESLRRFLLERAEALLSNDYFASELAWMDLNSPVDITLGPYETYEDSLFGYKATFEAFVGITDAEASEKVKLFSEHLQELEDNLPEAEEYKKTVEGSSPIRVVQLAYTGGDVAGPHVIAFNLPNDERVQKQRGTAMVMLKNVSQAKFDHILVPISEATLNPGQRQYVNFEAFFTHTLCHECCHGIGPHSIITPAGRASTVRQELQELYSAIEEAKADIVGLWAVQYLLDKGALPREIEKTVYVSFLAGCFRSVRFGLAEAHGKGQALQFNFLLEHGGFFLSDDGTFGVDFTRVKEAVKALSHIILTIEAQGDKDGARALLDKYGTLTPELEAVLKELKRVEVPVDVAVSFSLEADIASLMNT